MKINRSRPRPARIEMLPLIDVVFLLLVFFIYAMLSMSVHRGMRVNLPASATARPGQRSGLAITIRDDPAGGRPIIYLDEEPVELADLTGLLRTRARTIRQRDDKDAGVRLFAGKEVPYQLLFKVLDRINQAGLSGISLQAEMERPP